MKLMNQNINILKKGIIYKHRFCLLKKSSLTLMLVKLFLKYNLIKKFVEINYNRKNTLKIEYNYYSNSTLIKKLITYNRKQHHCLKQSVLKNLINNKFVCILSTSKGVLSDKDCLKNKLGGIIICKIYL